MTTLQEREKIEATDAAATDATASCAATSCAAASHAPPLSAAALLASGTLLEQFRRLRGPADALRNGDRQALRDHLVLTHTPLVEHCARGFAGADEPLEDLVQEGSIGLIKAVDRFDPDKGVRFSTYACHLITGEMRHYLRDRGKLIHEPGWHAQLRGQVGREAESLTQQMGRPPQPEEIAASLNVQPQIVRKALESYNLLTVVSLDTGDAGDDGTTGEALTGNPLDDAGAMQEPLATRVENHIMLNAALPQLRDLERCAVSLFFYEECSKTEIARRLGISVNYAAYLVRRGVENLRRVLETEPAAAGLAAGAAPVERVIALENLAAWIDEQTRRDEPARRGAAQHGARSRTARKTSRKPFALLRFHMTNWNEATAHLSAAQRDEAKAAVALIARGCCRQADRLLELSGGASSGLDFVAMLPDTGEAGRRAGERWLRVAGSKTSHARHPALPAGLRAAYRFVHFPGDGDRAQDLVQALFPPA